MRGATRGAALALAIAVTGCGGGNGVQDYCKKGVQAVCQRLFACDPQGAAQLYGSEASCESQNGSQCSNSECPSGKTFDQSAADQCLAAYASASCSDLEQGIYPSVCSTTCR
jgi:hypothetical protein